MRRVMLVLVLVIIVLLCAYAAWYTYERHLKIANNAACDAHLSQPALGVQHLCTYEVVPPALFDLARGRLVFGNLPPRFTVATSSVTDMLLGRYALQPAPAGCDQSATTTDCAKILSLSQSPPAQQQAATSTATAGNFSFEYPSDGFVSGFGWEQVAIPGAYNVTIPTSNGTDELHVFIFTEASSTTSTLTGMNPAARTLADYRADYPIAAASTHQILVNGTPTTVEILPIARILSSEDVSVNGIPMLKQRYSIGYWSLDQNGARVFDTSIEWGANNELRYVLYDGASFAIITGWQADSAIDQIARSVQLL